jgi:hypothetical protein
MQANSHEYPSKFTIMHSLFELPVSVLKDVMSEWVDVKVLAHLDSACCSAASRAAYLDILRIDSLLSPIILDLNRRIRVGFMNWFVSRGMTTRRFDYEEGESSELEPYKCFFDALGSRLEVLKSRFCSSVPRSASIKWNIMEVASTRCDRLKTLSIEGSYRLIGPSHVETLLATCAQTLENVFLRMSPMQEQIRNVFKLPQLRFLRFSEGGPAISTEVLCESIRHSPLLVSVLCPNLAGRDDCLAALAAHCPRLKLLGLGNFGTGTAALIRVLQVCTQLEALDIFPIFPCEHDAATGAQFEAITRYGTHIRALRVCLLGMSDFNGINVQSLCQMPRLSHVNISNLEVLSDDLWQAFAACQHFCANLRELELPCLTGTFSDEAFCTFLSRLSGLRKLDLLAYACVNDEVLRTISHSATLEELGISGCSSFTYIGIITLAEGCPALRSLHIDPDGTPFTPAVKHLWQLLRPQLVFFDTRRALRFSPVSTWERNWDATREGDVVW